MMIDMHKVVYSGHSRMVHSNPAKDAIRTEYSSRLMMYAIGDAVEDHEGSGKAGDGCYQPSYAALFENTLAHGQKYRCLNG